METSPTGPLGFPIRIVSGGQTGADRAALDVAAKLGLKRGGWCPRGRRAEDGPISDAYPLREAPLFDYAVRTRLNVRDSDATLVLYAATLDAGTRLTLEVAADLGRPAYAVNLKRPTPIPAVQGWLRSNRVRVLNVAGPRESRSPGLYQVVCDYLERLLARPGSNRRTAR
jgi:hypothetical protein